MGTREKIKSYLEGSEALLLEPKMFDDAIIGVTERADGGQLVAYDRQRVIEILMGEGMDRDEAEEYYSFNTCGAWAGEGTPIFVDTRWAE